MSSGKSSSAQLVWSALLGVGGAAGIFFAGHQFGAEKLDDAEKLANANGYQRGVNETRNHFEDSERRDEVMARLISLVQNPSVQSVLPEEEGVNIPRALEAASARDYERAISLLPSGVVALEDRKCVAVDNSFEVETGSSITACNRRVTALIGDLDQDGKLKVSIADRSFLIAIGEHAGDAYNSCGVNFERIVKPEDDSGNGVVRVSFTCRY